MDNRAREKYCRLDGTATAADDPKRGVWYSAGCTFWTDEWDRLHLRGQYRIPVCPHCGCPGMQIDADKWEVPDEYESTHPGYGAQLEARKNAPCSRLRPRPQTESPA